MHPVPTPRRRFLHELLTIGAALALPCAEPAMAAESGHAVLGFQMLPSRIHHPLAHVERPKHLKERGTS